MIKNKLSCLGKTKQLWSKKLNSYANGSRESNPLKVWGVEQSFSFPTLYSAERHSKQIEISMAEAQLNNQKNELRKNVSNAYFNFQILLNKQKLYQTLDSLYNVLLSNSEKRFDKGDISRLEVLNVKAKKNQVSVHLEAIKTNIDNAYKQLKVIMNYDRDFTIPLEPEILPEILSLPDSLPVFDLMKNQSDYYYSLVRIEKNKMLPDVSVNYFLGSNQYEKGKYYHGFQVGLAVPLFYCSYKSKIDAAKLSVKSQRLIYEHEIMVINNQLNELLGEQLKYRAMLNNYSTSGEVLKNEILKTALKSFQIGEINFFQFLSSYENAFEIQFEYLDSILKYNIIVSEIMYFSK